MTTKEFLIENNLSVVLTNFPADCLLYTVEALIKGGIKAVTAEFSGDSEKAERNGVLAATGLKKCFGNDLKVGIGNILSERGVNLAKGAGADFIISPMVSKNVILRANAIALPIISGGFTTTEIENAHSLGSAAVTLSPAKFCDNFSYAEFIKNALPQVNLAASGNLKFEDIMPLWNLGFRRFIIGKNLANITLAKKGEYIIIENEAKRYIELFQKLK